ncbi:MAG: hypothetical protein A2X86_02210 [Bdellovibrionales bacterium GWA2_49_15]|nr:MAG: hypothetical protein A2X86_02210 [Bdellovibrionales bacterium GWA2_49_15]
MSAQKFITFLCILLGLFSEVVWAGRLPKGMRKNSESVKEISKIFACARSFIEQAKGGDEAVLVALIYVKRVSEIVDDGQLLTELRKACWLELKEKAPMSQVDRSAMERKLAELAPSYPVPVVNVVSTLLNPNGSCRFVSLGFSVGLGLSFGLGLKAFRCESQDGRRFLALAPEVANGIGVGATVTAGMGDLELKKLTKGSPLAGVYAHQSSETGVIVVVQSAEGGLGVPYMLKEKSFGLGLGIFDMRKQFPMLRVIEQTDQFYALLNLLVHP